MKIAVSGLGKMGGQIAKMLYDDGHEVIAHNRSAGPIDEAKAYGATPAYTDQEVIDAFGGEPVVLWIMLPAGVIDSKIDEWAKILPQNSIVIDGGNSDYRGDKARADRLAEAGCLLLDVGTSGGVWGLTNGFSMMVGGDESAYQKISPALDTLAKPRGGHRHFGAVGAGHFVKMTHNAIEYGMMQSLAEGYRVLKEGPYKDLDLARAGDVWQESSVITSFLNDLTREALHENPEMNDISGVVAESGEARWTLETARELGIPMPAIQAAFDVRLASQESDALETGNINFATKLLAAMRNKFGGHNIDGKG